MHSLSPVGKITDIVKKLNSGIHFYATAIEKVAAPNCQAMFRRMWEEKQRAVRTLAPLSDLKAEKIEDANSTCIDFQNIYTKLLGAISSDKDCTYVKQLIDVEETILHTIDEALNEDHTPENASSLRLVRTRTQQCHDEMLSLYNASAPRLA
ncbi:DUF2383 domain-containing protein [Alteromonas sp. H39]|uniref:DUF2383 domain-containing protein n=1 Tax=Alteromonas sp. H39 TaxID=3389876 RepID=UPI0039E10DF0